MKYQFDVIPAFAVPVGITKIDKQFCEPLKDLVPINADMTAIPEEEQTLIYDQLDKVPEVRDEILKVFTGFINQIILRRRQDWAITSSWITENTNGVRMERHQHLNSYYSAVLYFSEVDKEHAPLKFESPLVRSGFWVEEGMPNFYTGADFTAPMEEGTILFFPSYLFHFHAPYKATEIPRKSLACNFIPVGKYGHFDSTLDTRKLHGQ
tara:strand:+ start:208 stop:834 length:627 start_codon:yes stop_codon:yes gene_type:complete